MGVRGERETSVIPDLVPGEFQVQMPSGEKAGVALILPMSGGSGRPLEGLTLREGDRVFLKMVVENKLGSARAQRVAGALLGFCDLATPGLESEFRTQKALADHYGVNPATIWRWVRAYEKEGVSSLEEKHRSGRPPKKKG